jgi:hypothetical protein
LFIPSEISFEVAANPSSHPALNAQSIVVKCRVRSILSQAQIRRNENMRGN